MKDRSLLLPLCIASALLGAPLVAWAHSNPDFDDDARPILNAQPGLLQYVKASFDIKDTGTAKFPGDDDHRPMPPFIFKARPLGSNGPYNLRLLIQPGPPGHILGVVDMNKVHLAAPPSPSSPRPPAVVNQAPPPYPAPTQTAPAPVTSRAPASPPPADQSQGLTSDTPSGPITDSGTPAPQPASGTPSLAPPPDPAPPTH